MRIIYVHQYFVRPEEGGAIRSYHLAKGMVEAGHEVVMVSSHNKKCYEQVIVDGIEVHYLPVEYSHHFTFWARIRAFMLFVWQAKKLLKKLALPDLFYITSTPLTTGLLGLWISKKWDIPYVFEVRDLWPEAPIQVGVIRNKLLQKWLYSLERKIYQGSAHLIALSPGIETYLHRQLPQKQLTLISNFSDCDYFVQETPALPALAEVMEIWKSYEVKIAYTGAIGEVNAVEELLVLAEAAANQGLHWGFLIMGDGKRLAMLQTAAKELPQVHFLPHGPKQEVREVLREADFAFVSFSQEPILQTNSPNKFFDALASSTAILINHKGWIRDLVIEEAAGMEVLLGEDPEKLKEQVSLIKNSLNKLPEMKANARKLALGRFSKAAALSRVLGVLELAVKERQA